MSARDTHPAAVWRLLGILTRANVVIMRAVATVAEEPAAEPYAADLLGWRAVIETGVGIAEGLRAFPALAPPFAARIVAAGEQAGTLDTAFGLLGIAQVWCVETPGGGDPIVRLRLERWAAELRIGVPMVQSLPDLASDLNRGARLAELIIEHPAHWPDPLPRLIGIAEQAGNVHELLRRLLPALDTGDCVLWGGAEPEPEPAAVARTICLGLGIGMPGARLAELFDGWSLPPGAESVAAWLTDQRDSIAAGGSLSDAIDRHPALLGPTARALIHLAERAGDLGAALGDAARRPER